MTQKAEHYTVIEDGSPSAIRVVRLGVGPLQTPIGLFHHFAFQLDDQWGKYSVLAMAELTPSLDLKFSNKDELLVRIDSGCETGQLFWDYTCECRQQLEGCLKLIAQRGEGLLIHIPRQDGRGMGLPFKLATLRIQKDIGVDTVEAFSLLDPDERRDIRTYTGAIGILEFLKIPTTTKLQLVSNNDHKASIFEENGFQHPELVPLIIPPTEHTRPHLEAKQKAMGHHLGLFPESDE